ASRMGFGTGFRNSGTRIVKISEFRIGASMAGPRAGPEPERSEMPIGPVAMKVVSAAVLLTASLAPAAAQFPDFRTLFTPNPAPGTVPAARDWSGEPGASGHQLMTREAILSAAANFGACIEALWP